MRLNKIILNDFRAFPGPEDYELPLNGKNLLLYGENGSGKSSIFVALREFFQRSKQAKDFDHFRHVFTKDAAGQPLGTGHVSIEFDDGNKHQWLRSGSRPSTPSVKEAALRFVALDYRALFDVHGRHPSGRPDLYSLLIESVLRELKILVKGRAPTSLGTLIDEAHAARPRRHTAARIKLVKQACADLTEAISNHLPQIVTEANRLLKLFGDLGMTFQLQAPTIDYKDHKFTGQTLQLAVDLYSYGPDEPQHFINEARLSALALAIHFAAALVTIPPGIPGSNTPSRVLVLDDVLIGLDLSNRIPVLRLLEQEFNDWQIILLTHDRVWFDLAREYTEHTKRWAYLKLFEMLTMPGQPARPRIDPYDSLLNVAEKHLKNGDHMAAAVYVRAAFETRLRNVCCDFGIQIAYKPDPKDVKADKLWEGIVDRQKTREKNGQKDFMNPSLMKDVETVRSTVLNRLSHSGSTPLVKSEVQFALDTIKKFEHEKFVKTP